MTSSAGIQNSQTRAKMNIGISWILYAVTSFIHWKMAT